MAAFPGEYKRQHGGDKAYCGIQRNCKHIQRAAGKGKAPERLTCKLKRVTQQHAGNIRAA